jgi:hypothetical protein
MSIRAGSRAKWLYWPKDGYWQFHRHRPLVDFQRRVSIRAGSPFRRLVFYAIDYKHSLIHQHRLDEYLHFHDHAWKRHNDRLDYRYRLGLRLRLDHATNQASTC